MRRRLSVAAGLAALGLSLAVPLASAHDDPQVHTVGWGASPDPTTANDGAQVYSNDEVIAAWADFDDGVKSWDVVMRPVGPNGGQPSTCHENLAPDNRGAYPTKVYINCPWDTTRAKNYTLPSDTPASVASKPRPDSPDEPQRVWQSQDLGPSVNGKYTIEINVTNAKVRCGLLSGCHDDTSIEKAEAHPIYQSGTNPARWREVWVVNGVSQPGGVTNSFDPASNRITVSWAPVPEPDVNYVVQEKVGDGKWGGGGTVPGNATRYDRVVDQPGTYQYRVAAVRPAPTSNGGNGASATKRSDYAAAQPVEIAQITPPSTAGANNAADPGDPGNPGVFIPEDTPTSTSAPGSHVGRPPKGTAAAGRSSGPATSGSRPPGSANRPAGSTAGEPGEAEGEGPDGGYSSTLPYNDPQDGLVEGDDGLGDEGGPQAFGGVVPKPRDTRQLLTFMAASLVLFVFAMQCTVLLRRSRPALAAAADDDFDDWLGF